MSSNKSGKGEHHRGGPGGLDCRPRRPALLLDPNPCLPVVPCTGEAGSPLYQRERGAAEGVAVYRDIPGFCKSATLDDIRQHGYVLTPAHYVGAAEQDEDDEPFEVKMARLVAQLREHQAEAAKLDAAIARNCKSSDFRRTRDDT